MALPKKMKILVILFAFIHNTAVNHATDQKPFPPNFAQYLTYKLMRKCGSSVTWNQSSAADVYILGGCSLCEPTIFGLDFRQDFSPFP
jgi:hypothetical protein